MAENDDDVPEDGVSIDACVFKVDACCAICSDDNLQLTNFVRWSVAN